MKYENPLRLKELDPVNTLKRIGVSEDSVVCDIGAGSGIFTIPAARITKNDVFAVEISDEMLAIISEKADAEKLDNVKCIRVENDRYAIEDGAVDLALLVTLFHEIANKADFLEEVKRVLKPHGKAAVIEFHKHETPMGPQIANRIAKEDADHFFAAAGFGKLDGFDLGDNFYCRIYGIR